MATNHLSDEQLAAFRDMKAEGLGVREHLQACRMCQARLREARMLRLLLMRPESPGGPHPEPEALAAYAEGSLGTRETPAVERHLAACPQCLADLEALHRTAAQPDGPMEPAPPAALAAARRAFEAHQPGRDLGRLIVEWIEDAGWAMRLVRPALPHARRRLRLSPVVGMVPRLVAPPALPFECSEDDTRAENAVLYAVSPARGYAEPAPRPSPGTPGGRPVRVVAGAFVLTLEISGTSAQAALAVSIRQLRTRTPVEGGRLRLESETAPPQTATTDAAGRATLALAPGPAMLHVEQPFRATLPIIF